jgi:hypothetical protein
MSHSPLAQGVFLFLFTIYSSVCPEYKVLYEWMDMFLYHSTYFKNMWITLNWLMPYIDCISYHIGHTSALIAF